jgi:hypothetical protein
MVTKKSVKEPKICLRLSAASFSDSFLYAISKILFLEEPMKLFFAALLMTITLLAQARVSKMAVITSEFDKNIRDYYLETDSENNIHSLRYVTTMPNGAILEDVSLTPEQVVEDGVVVFEHKGYQAVILEVENFNVRTGGTIKLNYLSSGVTGSRNIKRFTLKKVNNDFLFFDQNQRVNKMFFEVNRSRVLGVIGVKSIQSSFDPDLTQ